MRVYLLVVAIAAVAVVGCQSGGNVSLFGYSTAPPFDPNIKTVYVPVFKNTAFQTTPNRDVEVDLTVAIIREIHSRSTMRVVSDRDVADTELLGTIYNIEKNIYNRNQQNHVRDAEIIVSANIVWRDMRTGRVLSNRRPFGAAAVPAVPFDPSLPPPDPVLVKEIALPVKVVATGRLIPELGETNATANKSAVDMMAKQIVNMMEIAW